MANKEVKMWMSFDDTGDESVLTGTFSDEDLRRLDEYCSHAEDLWETRVIKDGFPKDVNFRLTPETGSSIEAEPFEDEFISSFLHKLRPIFLEEEPASFKRTAGLIAKRFADKAMKKHLKAIRQAFETSKFAAFGQVTIGGVPVFDQETIKKWLYAFEYHQDPDKREFLRHIETEFGRKGARIIFIQQLKERFEGIFHLHKLARFILDFE